MQVSEKMEISLDKSIPFHYILFYDKGRDEEEYTLPLKRESGRPVSGC